VKVAIVHPWFPQYRERFFELLVTQARIKGITIDVFHGSPPPEWGERGDSVLNPIAKPLNTRFFRLGDKHLVLKSLAEMNPLSAYDLVIVEHAVRNIETYRLIFGKFRARVAFWGHGKTYTETAGGRQEALKRWLAAHGAWFFAYTDGGSKAVAAIGFDPDRITVVQNAIDTHALAAAIDDITPAELEKFKLTHALTVKTALFIGGLDDAKRLPFLIQAAVEARKLDDDFRLLVVGNGALAPLIESVAREHDWLVYLGALFGRDKALAMKSAMVLAMPGRVGLVAVDSFAARTPIVTTDWSLHAPEFEYLKNSVNSVITANEPNEYARELISLMNNTELLQSLERECESDARIFTVESMASNFLQGIEKFRERARR